MSTPAEVPVDDEGRFTADVPDYEGLNVFDANPQVIRDLRAGLVLAQLVFLVVVGSLWIMTNLNDNMMPPSIAPFTKRSRWASISALIFLPMARRSRSASPSE